jgi:hypothetical protein
MLAGLQGHLFLLQFKMTRKKKQKKKEEDELENAKV